MLKQYLLLLLLVTASGALCLHSQDLAGLKNQQPFSLNGAAQVRGIFYNASGIADRRRPFSWLFSGNVTANIYGVSLPVNFTFSESDRSFRQPFNQFGINPHYRWITLHIGYSNVNFSPYTLAGYTLLGAGIELTPGKFRFGFMYGRLNRATTLDTATLSLAPVSFTRKAIAAKIGYGTENSFIDLSVLKGKDDPGSVRVPKGILDSLDVLPAANTVVAAGARVSFTKNLYAEGDIGTSLFTADINSPLTLDSVNEPAVKSLKTFATINGTSQLFTAMSGSIGYKTKSWAVKGQYRRVDPGFQSMGAYFFNNDLESYTLIPSFRIFKNKFRFNGSIGFQHDNLQRQKESTTHRIVATAVASADLTKQFGIDLNYSNFSNNQQPNTIRFADSLKIVQTTQNFSISPRWMLMGKKYSHAVVASVNMMQLNDFNNYFSQNAVSRNMNYKQYYLNYTIGLVRSALSLFINLSATDVSAAGTDSKSQGGALGLSKSFDNAVFLIAANGGYFFGSNNGTKDNTINATANVTFRFQKKHSLNALFFYTSYKPVSVIVSPAFMETRAELGYGYRF